VTSGLPRYQGLCGAIVTVRRHSGGYDGYAWHCQSGAGKGYTWDDVYQPTGYLEAVRAAANAHAAECRALPPTE